VACGLINLSAGFDARVGDLRVARDYRVDGRAELIFGEAAHFDNGVAQLLQFLVISSDQVLGSHRLSFLFRSAQPNRPVVYSSVCLSFGRVKMRSVSSHSTNSPSYLNAVHPEVPAAGCLLLVPIDLQPSF